VCGIAVTTVVCVMHLFAVQKVVELALGCLHKLVAHAWLHGESTAAGTMDILSAHGSLDDDDTVANVIKMVIKCGETTNEALQLAVVRALLTFTTAGELATLVGRALIAAVGRVFRCLAYRNQSQSGSTAYVKRVVVACSSTVFLRAEHFIAHGECLLSAVRAVFNLALGAENPVNKRTASNALLQMLNTICKRVTQIQPRITGGSSECSSRTVSEALELYYSVQGAGFHNHSPRSAKGSGTHLDHMAVMSPLAPIAGQGSGPLPDSASGVVYDPDAPSTAPAAAGEAGARESSGGRISSSSTASTAAAARAAQLTELAAKKDLQGLEAALEAAAAAADDADDGEEDETAEMRTSATAAVVSAGLQSLSAAAGSSAGGAPPSDANGMSAQQQAVAGSPAQPPQLQQQSSVGPPAGPLHPQTSWQQQQFYHGRMSGTPSYAGRGARHGQRLTTQEKDVLLVLTAFCKLASREVPGGTASSDSVLAQGKLLALEMLAKVSPVLHQYCTALCNPASEAS
jgi:hypothetical protein